MSKIGLLTFSNTQNYGAALQCYALSKYLQNMGNDVEVFDYRNTNIELTGKRRLKSIHTPKDLILWALTHKEFRLREKEFDQFNSDFLNLVSCDGVEQLRQASKDYDYFIVGSDQVWNYNLTKSDETYFFPFKSLHAKKIAYSASFGSCGIDLDQWKSIKEYISDFHAISVREASGAELLKDKTGIDASFTIDPTLILNKDTWKSMARKSPEKTKYVLAYVISKRELVTDSIIRMGKKMNLPVVIIQTGTIHTTSGAKDIKLASPQDFIDYFYNAEYVVTDSFHGTCFSLIFEKDFHCILGSSDGANSRIIDLLNSIGLKDRIEGRNTDKIQYEKVNERLNRLAEQSRKYLERALSPLA